MRVSGWPVLADRQSSTAHISQCPGSLIAAHASSPAHAQFSAATGRRPPPPGHCINLARPHCEETATALQTQPCRNQCGHWSPLYAGTAHSWLRARSAWPLGPLPPAGTCRCHLTRASALVPIRPCVHRMLAQATTGDFVQCTMHHHLPSPPAWPSTDSSLHPRPRLKLLQVTIVSSPPCCPEHSRERAAAVGRHYPPPQT